MLKLYGEGSYRLVFLGFLGRFIIFISFKKVLKIIRIEALPGWRNW